MQGRIQKWGNSLALRIPKALIEQANLQEDEQVEITIKDGKLVIEAIDHEYTLEELLAGVTDENIHEEIDFGPPVGKEIW